MCVCVSKQARWSPFRECSRFSPPVCGSYHWFVISDYDLTFSMTFVVGILPARETEVVAENDFVFAFHLVAWRCCQSRADFYLSTWGSY